MQVPNEHLAADYLEGHCVICKNELFPPRVRQSEPLGAKTSMKKPDGSASGFAVGDPLASLADADDVH